MALREPIKDVQVPRPGQGKGEKVLLPGYRGEAEREPQPFCSPSPGPSISCSGPQWVAGLGHLGDVVCRVSPWGTKLGREKWSQVWRTVLG